MTVTIEIDKGFDALRTLLDGRDRGVFSDAEFFRSVAERAPLCIIKVETSAATGARHTVYSYQPSDEFQEFLAAMRTRNREGNYEGEFAAVHG
jgi:hypothetical protein